MSLNSDPKFAKSIWPTGDRKTWAGPWQKNTFGLMPGNPKTGGSCPGATAGKGGCLELSPSGKSQVCYVMKLIKCYGGVKGVLVHNQDLLMAADYQGKVAILDAEFHRFYHENLAHKEARQNYRLHWSGDFFDEEYVCAMVEAIEKWPQIQFWNYTKSMFAIPHLAGIANLQQYISADNVNSVIAVETWKEFKAAGNIHIAYMADTNPGRRFQDEVMIPCPVDDGNMPLEGSCQKCRLCIKGKNIWFRTKAPAGTGSKKVEK